MWRSPAVISSNKKNQLTKEHPTGAFLDEYEGGWQELLPNINDPTNYKGSSLGFHGEACFRIWDYQVITDTVEEVKIRFSLSPPSPSHFPVCMPWHLRAIFCQYLLIAG
ncbi:hypothetical protein LLG07_02410 [bacterium]|nr:hypothetical protein [bacterium]